MLERACRLYQHVETWLIAFGVVVCCSALKVQVRELTRDKLGITADVSAVVEVNGHFTVNRIFAVLRVFRGLMFLHPF